MPCRHLVPSARRLEREAKHPGRTATLREDGWAPVEWQGQGAPLPEAHSEWPGEGGDGDDTVAGLPQSEGQRAAKSPEDFSGDDGIEFEKVQ